MARQDTGAGLSARVVRGMVARCVHHGCDPFRLCAVVGLDPELLDDPNARIPHALVEALGEQALALTSDDAFGLHLAEDLRARRSYDVGLLLLMASPDLGSALEHFVASQAHWGDGQRASLIRADRGLTVRYALPSAGGPYGRHAAECALAEIAIGAELLVGRSVEIDAVRFQHARPPCTKEHERVFRRCPSFEAGHNEITFSPNAADATLQSPGEDFFAVFASQMQNRLSQLGRSTGTASDVRTAARPTLKTGGPSLSDVARILRTSPRTLQRRLQAEGTCFADVIEDLRQELAQLYLSQRTPVAEVASRLGYADATAFCHAFRRWTGASPAQANAEASPEPSLD